MLPCCGLPMSSHQVTRHGYKREELPTVPALHSLPLTLRIRSSHPCYPPTVCFFGPVSGPRPTGVAYHADRLSDVGQQAHPVKDGHQGVERTLDPGGVQRDDHAVVCVEKCRLVTSLPPRFPFFLSLID